MEKLLSKAKMDIFGMDKMTFIRNVLFSLKHEISNSIPTAATNGVTILYNPEFISKLTRQELIGLMLHEAWHVALSHVSRINGRKHEIWNMAGDYVINLMLDKEDIILPEGGLLDNSFDGWTTDQVYEYLLSNAIELPEDFIPDIQDGISEEDKQNLTEILVRSATQAKMEGQYGDIPSEVTRGIDQLINPKLPWNEVLYRFLDSKAKDDYSWSRPNRRYLPDYYLPSQYSESIDSITIALDTSGSVTDEMLKEMLSEIQYIKDTYQPKQLTIIDCDCRINNVWEAEDSDSILDLKFTGGGGTSMVPILEYCKENTPNVLIYFTDGEMNLGMDKPEYDVLWIIYDNPSFKQPFGEVVLYDI